MITLVLAEIQAPKVAYALISPMLIIFAGALLSVFLEAALPRKNRATVQIVVTLATLLSSLVAVISVARESSVRFSPEDEFNLFDVPPVKGSTLARAVMIDSPALVFQGTIIALALVALFMFIEKYGEAQSGVFVAQGSSTPGSPYEAATSRLGWAQTEIFPLFLFSVGGMLLFTAANDLLTLFVALEVFSLPLYILCGLARWRRLLSQEAALKYFLLGAFSSAFFLFGSGLIFGFAGSLNLSDIATAISRRSDAEGLLTLGTLMVFVGLLFKVGAVPFHAWTPDVYQGAPTPLTGFMGVCTKVAAFAAVCRVLYVGFAPSRWDWSPLLWGVAIATMLIGAIFAVTQTDIKRLLAYSSIAHAGFVLVGILAFDRAGLAAVMFYLITYGITTIGSFAIVGLLRDEAGEANHLSQWVGIGKSSPVVAACFSFLLLALAGIPLTSGFTAKFAVFAAAGAHGGTWLVAVAVLASAIAAFFYLRIIVLMYFSGPQVSGVRVLRPGVFGSVTIALTVLVTLLLGVWPSALLELTQRAAIFIR